MKKILQYVFYVLFVGVLLIGGLILLKSWNDLQNMQDKVSDLQAKLRERNNECTELHQDIYDLKNNPDAVEKVAREKFRLCRENEIIFTYKPEKRENLNEQEKTK